MLLITLWSFEKIYYINILKQKLSFDNLLDERSVIERNQCHIAAKFREFVDEDSSRLPTLQ